MSESHIKHLMGGMLDAVRLNGELSTGLCPSDTSAVFREVEKRLVEQELVVVVTYLDGSTFWRIPTILDRLAAI